MTYAGIYENSTQAHVPQMIVAVTVSALAIFKSEKDGGQETPERLAWATKTLSDPKAMAEKMALAIVIKGGDSFAVSKDPDTPSKLADADIQAIVDGLVDAYCNV